MRPSEAAELINQDESRFGLSETPNRFFFSLCGSLEDVKDWSPPGRREEKLTPLGRDGTVHRQLAQKSVSLLFLADSRPNLGLNTEMFILRKTSDPPFV